MGTLSFLQATTLDTDTTAYTFSSENLGTAAADRHIIIAASTRTSGGVTLSSATINGESATVSVQDTNGDICVAIIIAAVPSDTSGDVVITWSGATDRCAICVYRATGLDSITATDTDFAGGNPSTASLTKADGIAIAAAATSQSSTNFTITNMTTEDADSAVENLSFASASEESSAGAVSIEGSSSPTGAGMTLVAATWEYSVGGGILKQMLLGVD